jgi:hypothetical protein
MLAALAVISQGWKEVRSMDAQTLGNQVKGILDDSAARLKGLENKGLKVVSQVAAQVKDQVKDQATLGQDAIAKGQKVLAKGQKAVHDLLGDIRPQDLLERYGKHTVPELVEKLKSSDLTRHTEALRGEILGFLKVPQAEQVSRLEVAVVKLNKEIAGLKGLKADIKKLSEQVKAAQAAAKLSAKPAPKAK